MKVKTQIIGQSNTQTIEIDGWVNQISSPNGDFVLDTTIDKRTPKSLSKEQVNEYQTDCYYLDITKCIRYGSKGVLADEWIMYHVFSVNENGTVNLHLIADSRHFSLYIVLRCIHTIVRTNPSVHNSLKNRKVFFSLSDYAYLTQFVNCTIHSNSQTWEVTEILENEKNVKDVKDLIKGKYISSYDIVEFETNKFYYSICYIGNNPKQKNHYNRTFFSVNTDGSLNILDAIILTDFPEYLNPKFVTDKPILERDFYNRILPIFQKGFGVSDELQEGTKEYYESKDLSFLRKLKEERYSNMDISSAMSADEKLLTKVISDKYSVLNQEVKAKRDKTKKTEYEQLNKEMVDFDWTSILNIVDTTTGGEEIPIVKPPKLTDFQLLTLKLLNEAKDSLKYWESKTYKNSNKQIFVGDELTGKNLKIGDLNYKRKMNGIKHALNDIKTYEKDLRDSGYYDILQQNNSHIPTSPDTKDLAQLRLRAKALKLKALALEIDI